jgi:hypothetical protein
MTSTVTPGGLFKLGTGFWASKAFLSAVELGVFTKLTTRPVAISNVSMQGRKRGLIEGFCRRALSTTFLFLAAWSVTPPTPSLAASSPSGGDFDFTVNFDNLPEGAFTLTQQKSVFTDPHIIKQYNTDSTGTLMSVVTSGCKGAHCVRHFYPTGALGSVPPASSGRLKINAANGFYLILTNTPVLNIEYDWMFEGGFDLNQGGGKIGGFPEYGVNGSLRRGTDLLVYWRSLCADRSTDPCFAADTQDQATGQTTQSYGPHINTGQWYHIHAQLAPGPRGWQKVWVDNKLFYNHGPSAASRGSSPTDTPIANFRSWFGGGSSNYSPKNDSYARIDHIRIWSGTGP